MANEDSRAWGDLRLASLVAIVMVATFFFAQTVLWVNDPECDNLAIRSCVSSFNE